MRVLAGFWFPLWHCLFFDQFCTARIFYAFAMSDIAFSFCMVYVADIGPFLGVAVTALAPDSRRARQCLSSIYSGFVFLVAGGDLGGIQLVRLSQII